MSNPARQLIDVSPFLHLSGPEMQEKLVNGKMPTTNSLLFYLAQQVHEKLHQQPQQDQQQIDGPIDMISPVKKEYRPDALIASAADTTTAAVAEDGVLDLSASGQRNNHANTLHGDHHAYGSVATTGRSVDSGYIPIQQQHQIQPQQQLQLEQQFQQQQQLQQQQQFQQQQLQLQNQQQQQLQPIQPQYPSPVDSNSDAVVSPVANMQNISAFLLQTAMQQQQHLQNHQQFAAAAAAAAAVAASAAASSANRADTSPTSSTPAAATSTTRPFKSFPRDPTKIAASFSAAGVIKSGETTYDEYRAHILDQIRVSNGGHATVSNPRMRRTKPKSRSAIAKKGYEATVAAIATEAAATNTTGTEATDTEETCGSDDNSMSMSPNGGNVKDAAYYERRQKNNAAAKKSRDRRRIKEDEIAIRNRWLEEYCVRMSHEHESMRQQLLENNIVPAFNIQSLKGLI